MKCHEFLTKAMRDMGLNQLDVAKGVSVTRQAVAKWMHGETVPYGHNLDKLAKFFGVSPETILFGGEAAVSTIPDSVLLEGKDSVPSGYVVINESTMRASAGPGYDNSWDEVHGATPAIYRESFLKSRGIKPEDCRRITADGDSMIPTICDGDKILFANGHNLQLSEVRDGDIYVLNIFGKMKVKRLATTADTLIVRSDNKIYEDERFSGEDLESITIFGKVIEITRTL